MLQYSIGTIGPDDYEFCTLDNTHTIDPHGLNVFSMVQVNIFNDYFIIMIIMIPISLGD